jgi:DNA-binding NarL/FixJ family response regulator
MVGRAVMSSGFEESDQKRILVVDDHAIIRKGLKTAFEDEGGLEICGEAASGAEAIEKAEELKPDLVILDFAMPGMNGLDTAISIKRKMPAVLLVLYTVYKTELGERAKNNGIDAIVSKLDGSNILLQQVRNLLYNPHGESTDFAS